jgi:hypothetical protein
MRTIWVVMMMAVAGASWGQSLPTWPTVPARKVLLGGSNTTAAQAVELTSATAALATANQSVTGVWTFERTITANDGLNGTTVTLSGAAEAATLNTGQGAYELYAMDQNVRTSDSPVWVSPNATTGINTGAGAGTQRIDASGNLVNIGNITGTGTVTLATASDGNIILTPNGTGNIGLWSTTPAVSSFGKTLKLEESANALGLITVASTSSGTGAGSFFSQTNNLDVRLGFGTYGSGNTGTALFGVARANHSFIYTLDGDSTGLTIGTLTDDPLRLGTNNATNVTITATALNLATGLALQQNGTERISSAGAGTLASLALTTALPLTSGGSAKSLTAAAGGIIWTDANSMEVSAAGSSGQLLVSNGTSAPGWTSTPALTALSVGGVGIDPTGGSAGNVLAQSASGDFVATDTLAVSEIRISYDTAANQAARVLAAGEIAAASDTKAVLLGDGVTAGGVRVGGYEEETFVCSLASADLSTQKWMKIGEVSMSETRGFRMPKNGIILSYRIDYDVTVNNALSIPYLWHTRTGSGWVSAAALDGTTAGTNFTATHTPGAETREFDANDIVSFVVKDDGTAATLANCVVHMRVRYE